MQTHVPDDWFVGFHTGLVARFWREAGATMAEADAEAVLRLLALPPGARVVDVPCADGRIALRLAAAGYAVTGIDIAEAELELARRSAASQGVAARLLAGDLRDLPDAGPADGLVSWGNSFGYLTPADTARSLAGMRRLLRPGGRLVLESMTVAESLLPAGIEERSEIAFGGIRMARVNRYDPTRSRLETEYELTGEDGTVERTRAAHHVHTAGEVVRMLGAAGFGAVELRAGDGTAPYALGERRMIAVARAEP